MIPVIRALFIYLISVNEVSEFQKVMPEVYSKPYSRFQEVFVKRDSNLWGVFEELEVAVVGHEVAEVGGVLESTLFGGAAHLGFVLFDAGVDVGGL